MSDTHAMGYQPVDQTYWPDGTPRREVPRPCFCEGPWANVEPADRPETRLGFEHVEGSNGCVYAAHYAQPRPETPGWWERRQHLNRDGAQTTLCEVPFDRLDRFSNVYDYRDGFAEGAQCLRCEFAAVVIRESMQ